MIRGAFKIEKRQNLGKVPTRGGSSKIQKVPKFQLGKVQKEAGVITFQKSSKFPMANNTLIFHIVVDFVSNVTISNYFRDFGGGHSVSKCSQVQKSPKSGRGWGGHRHLGTFPMFWRFLILKAPLTYLDCMTCLRNTIQGYPPGPEGQHNGTQVVITEAVIIIIFISLYIYRSQGLKLILKIPYENLELMS